MAESNLDTVSRIGSDLAVLSSDEDEFGSSASAASAGLEEPPAAMEDSHGNSTMATSKDSGHRQTMSLTPDNSNNNNDVCDYQETAKPDQLNSPAGGGEPGSVIKRTLHLLDLPMDILKEITKEVLLYIYKFKTGVYYDANRQLSFPIGDAHQ